MKIVKSGAVGLCFLTRDGRRQISEFFLSGDLITTPENDTRGVWLESLSSGEFWNVPVADSVFSFSDAHMASFEAVLLSAFRDQLSRAQRHVAILGRLDGPERVDTFLVDMVERIGLLEGQCWKLRIPFGRNEIADYLGLNSETVSRILKRSAQQGEINLESPREIEVPDLEVLRVKLPL